MLHHHVESPIYHFARIGYSGTWLQGNIVIDYKRLEQWNRKNLEAFGIQNVWVDNDSEPFLTFFQPCRPDNCPSDHVGCPMNIFRLSACYGSTDRKFCSE